MIGNGVRVIVQLQGFGMVSQIMIGGIYGRSPRISNPGAYYPFYLPKLGIRTPESSQGQGGCFQVMVPGGLRDLSLMVLQVHRACCVFHCGIPPFACQSIDIIHLQVKTLTVFFNTATKGSIIIII